MALRKIREDIAASVVYLLGETLFAFPFGVVRGSSGHWRTYHDVCCWVVDRGFKSFRVLLGGEDEIIKKGKRTFFKGRGGMWW